MYYFMATYENMDSCKKISKNIKFDGQFFNTEKECYMHAMEIAYSMKKENECLASVEFLAC